MRGAAFAFRRPLLPDGSDGLRLEVRELLAGARFQPRSHAWREDFDPVLSRRLAARGWVGMTWPPRYGGGGGSALDHHVVTEELLAAGAPVAAHWPGERRVGPLLLRRGTETARAELLPAMAAGDRFCCVGTPVPASHPLATPVDGGLLITAGRLLARHAHRADYVLVPARTAGRDRPAQALVGLRAPGVEVQASPGPGGDGPRREIVLGGVFVPDAMLLDHEEDPTRTPGALLLEWSGPERFLGTFPLLRRVLDGVPPDEARAVDAVGRLTARLWALRRLSLSVAGAVAAGESPATEAMLVAELGRAFERDVVETARDLAPAPGELLALAEPATDPEDA